MSEPTLAPQEEVWIAVGLRKPHRVCSLEQTFGEFDTVMDAQTFLHLLLIGNPQLRKLA